MTEMPLCEDLLRLSQKLRGQDEHELSRKVEYMLNHMRASSRCAKDDCPLRAACNKFAPQEDDIIEFADAG
ncbi:MAG: hypothetical protein AAGL49_10605 [Pseudomonadota bacterium]